MNAVNEEQLSTIVLNLSNHHKSHAEKELSKCSGHGNPFSQL
jgi:hypothetical protein